MGYSNSPLVSYTKLTKNHSGLRNHQIDTITIHCYVGQVTAKSGVDYFYTQGELYQQWEVNPKTGKKERKGRGCSSNYVIGKDGDIGLSVEEKNRSWCTSSSTNDQRAVTIEVASDTKAPYAVTDKAYNALIQLVADICKRNGIKKLVWSTDKNQRVNHLNGCNMTVHRDYAAKDCPGAYLYDRHGEIADKVNAILGGGSDSSGLVGDMTKDELKKFIEEVINGYGVGLPASTWAVSGIEDAKGYGISDGSNPKKLATREEVMVMTLRAIENKKC
jgi:hypothetical protein